MSVFDRRQPDITPPPPAQRMKCQDCAFWSYDPEAALAHMATHPDRRAISRRLSGSSSYSVMSPAVRRFLDAADRGEGLHLSNRRQS